MRRLPNVNTLIAQIRDKADRELATVKTAGEETPQFQTSVASAMHKLAQTLRSIDPNAVSMEEIRGFAKSLLGS